MCGPQQVKGQCVILSLAASHNLQVEAYNYSAQYMYRKATRVEQSCGALEAHCMLYNMVGPSYVRICIVHNNDWERKSTLLCTEMGGVWVGFSVLGWVGIQYMMGAR